MTHGSVARQVDLILKVRHELGLPLEREILSLGRWKVGCRDGDDGAHEAGKVVCHAIDHGTAPVVSPKDCPPCAVLDEELGQVGTDGLYRVGLQVLWAVRAVAKANLGDAEDAVAGL